MQLGYATLQLVGKKVRLVEGTVGGKGGRATGREPDVGRTVVPASAGHHACSQPVPGSPIPHLLSLKPPKCLIPLGPHKTPLDPNKNRNPAALIYPVPYLLDVVNEAPANKLDKSVT